MSKKDYSKLVDTTIPEPVLDTPEVIEAVNA
jgi:hypothetical protein